MNTFKKGDILRGNKRKFKESYHPIVYISGPIEAPLAIVLTQSETERFPCNIKLSSTYDKKSQYFVGHLIQKMSEWGPYKKEGEVTPKDKELIESNISGVHSITWAEYVDYTKNGCPNHKNI